MLQPPKLTARNWKDEVGRLSHDLASIHKDGAIIPIDQSTDVATLAALLEQCGKSKALLDGKRLHEQILKFGHLQSKFLENCLLRMYYRCGSMVDALETFSTMRTPDASSWTILMKTYAENNCLYEAKSVFVHIPHKDVVSWNVIIAAYTNSGQGEEALFYYHQMQINGVEPTEVTFICILEACTSVEFLNMGRRLHASIIKSKYGSHVSICNALITMYGRCGQPDEALGVLMRMQDRDVVTWSALISAYTQNGHGEAALEAFYMMVEYAAPNSVTFISVVTACVNVGVLEEGLKIHFFVIICGYEQCAAIANGLVNMYGQCGSLHEARDAFNYVKRQDKVAWCVLIKACGHNSHCKEALQLFYQMQQNGICPDKVTVVCALDVCASLQNLAEGQILHAGAVKVGFDQDIVFGNALINMYCKCKSLPQAEHSFTILPQKNVVTWSTMIAACAHNGYEIEALHIFQEMYHLNVKPNNVTFVSLLEACIAMEAFQEGQRIHFLVIDMGYEQDIIVATVLVNMYGKSNCLHEARNVFDRISQRNLVVWNSMIGACTYMKHNEEALDLFNQMQTLGLKPSTITFVSVLDACMSLMALNEGNSLYAAIVESSCDNCVVILNALLSFYDKCGRVHESINLFSRIPQRDVVSWNSIISACVRDERDQEALEYFCQMRTTDLEPNTVTFICVLDACSSLATIIDGRHIHASLLEAGCEVDSTISSALINLYGKCGEMEEVIDVFFKDNLEDVHPWNALISACALNGRDKEALHYFYEMQLQQVQPNVITFVFLLTACSHGGRVVDGSHHFTSIHRDFGTIQSVEHYTCLIDLFGRAGCLEEAEKLIEAIPLKQAHLGLASLLGACNIHADHERGIQAATQMVASNPWNVSSYIYLSKI